MANVSASEFGEIDSRRHQSSQKAAERWAPCSTSLASGLPSMPVCNAPEKSAQNPVSVAAWCRNRTHPIFPDRGCHPCGTRRGAFHHLPSVRPSCSRCDSREQDQYRGSVTVMPMRWLRGTGVGAGHGLQGGIDRSCIKPGDSQPCIGHQPHYRRLARASSNRRWRGEPPSSLGSHGVKGCAAIPSAA